MARQRSNSVVSKTLKLCEKYLREGDELLVKKDYVQASEKFWEVAS